MAICVIVNGALGKMGEETCKAIKNDPEFFLAGKACKNDNLSAMVKSTQAQVVVDFTNAHCAYHNACVIIEAGAHPVIGTTGFSAEQIHDLTQRCAQKKLGGIIAPNFSLGAVLMMKYARDCAHYLPNVEIIEMHHDEKIDAPSGTAIKTAEMIAETRAKSTSRVIEKELLTGARGGIAHDIHIHSVRLPGLVAHQAVIFGNRGETLTIRHDMLHRQAAMAGVILACKKVFELKTLVYGLENIL